MMSRLLSRVHPTFVCLIVILLVLPTPVHAYAVLAHEAIIDAAWETHIRPLLLKKFPQATEEDLSRAQAYAYGGAIIQDMGYYPYGSPFFSDLTHYIRSGDFIQALLRDAKDINEYAFAVGALAHCAADNDGHRLGTNRAVPILYPGLRKKFGDSVTFKDGIPNATKRKFLFNLSRSNYEREWGKDYRKPSPGERFLAFLFTLIPKFGPLKVLQFKTPTPQTEQMFEASFNATLDRYRKLLTGIHDGQIHLPNDNFDVGESTGPGKYRLNDEAHAQLLDRLAEKRFVGATPEVKAELGRFFAEPDAPYATKRNAKAWAKVQTQLQQLKAVATAPGITDSSLASPCAAVP